MPLHNLGEAVPSLVGSRVRAGVALSSSTWPGRFSTGDKGPPGRSTRLDGIRLFARIYSYRGECVLALPPTANARLASAPGARSQPHSTYLTRAVAKGSALT